MVTIQPKIEKVVLDDSYGKFIVEPLERGYGVTVGNSLRRVLLSSLTGAAVTYIKIGGILHEFSTIPGVLEDVTDIVLNLKGLRLKLATSSSQILYLEAKGKGDVTAGNIKPNSEVEILDPSWHIATITDKNAKLSMEIGVGKGKGYVPAEKHKLEEDIGIIPIDSIFSPVKKVNFTVEDTRVGQFTDYNRLILEVWVDGSITPDEAVSQAAKILLDYLSIFRDITLPSPPEVVIPTEGVMEPAKRILSTPLEEMDFSVRTSRCFKKAKIITLEDLVRRRESELMSVRNFGKTSLDEVKEKLVKINLSLKEEEDKS